MKPILSLFIMAVIAGLAAPAGAQQAVSQTGYYKLPGLGTPATRDPVSGDNGEVWVSKYIQAAKGEYTLGAVLPNYIDGYHAGKTVQVYTLVKTDGTPISGLTNMVIALEVPGSFGGTNNPASGRWQTMGGFPATVVNPLDPNEYDPLSGSNFRVQFPYLAPGNGFMHFAEFGANDEQAIVRYEIWPDPTESLFDIYIEQTVLPYADRPYFDILWTIWTNSRVYNGVKFWHAVDSYTSGCDFGYGYQCSITKIAGGTGGRLFFQGTIALTPSDRQIEDDWAQNFYYALAGDGSSVAMPKLCLNPLGSRLGMDPLCTTGFADMAHLQDNGFSHEWSRQDNTDLDPDPAAGGITIGPTPIHILTRWTFDDPIRQSTYGNPHSQLSLNTDDYSEVFDVDYEPTNWEGHIRAFTNPKACESQAECIGFEVENCLPSGYCGIAECVDRADCSGLPNGHLYECLYKICVEMNWQTESALVPGGNGNRNIFTVRNGTAVDFTSAVSGVVRSEMMTALGAADDTHLNDIISFLRGQLTTGDPQILPSNTDLSINPLTETRFRDTGGWALGDIVHATPVYTGAQSNNFSRGLWVPDGSYAAFRDSFQYQVPVLYAAANDGMLHAFNAETGEELWAYLPWDLLPDMAELTKPYYTQLRTPKVDLSPMVMDVYWSGAWRTVLVIGERGGGTYYHALEVYNPDSGLDRNERPNLLWSFTHADLGQTWSEPAIVRYDTDKWHLYFGSGYAEHSADQLTKRAYLFGLNLIDGTLLAPESGNNVPYEIKDMAAGGTTLENNAIAGVTAYDIDGDGLHDRLYFGDLAGQLWKVKLDEYNRNSEGMKLGPRTVKLMMRTGTTIQQKVVNLRQGDVPGFRYTYSIHTMPISSRPMVGLLEDEASPLNSPANSSRPIVIFGTGKFDNFYDSIDEYLTDLSSAASTRYFQRVFAVVDRDDLDGHVLSASYDVTTGAFGVFMDGLSNPTALLSPTPGDGLLPQGLFRYSTPDTSGNPAYGWSVELGNPVMYTAAVAGGYPVLGERVVTNGTVAGEWAFFTTFTPDRTGTCDIEGGGYLMVLDIYSGGSPQERGLFDLNGDGTYEQLGGQYLAGMYFEGNILSAPVVDWTGTQSQVFLKVASDEPPVRIRMGRLMDVEELKTMFYSIEE